MPIWLLICLILSGSGVLRAQYSFEKSILFNKENGLPTNEVRTIAKSEDGFMWMGTAEGLCRFDGIQFRIYKPRHDDPQSLFSKEVNAILPDRGRIWVGTSMGLSVLDIATNTFRNYQFTGKGKADSLVRTPGMDVNTLCKDKDGNIWIGTRRNGACRYVPEKDDFVFYPYVQPDTGRMIPGGYHTILSLGYSRKNDSIMYAGSLSGLIEINKYTGAVRNRFFWRPQADFQTSVNAFRRLHVHDDGMVYAGSWRTGVHVYNPEQHTLLPIVPYDAEPILKHAVSAIRRKSTEEIWITTGGGLLVYNTRQKQITFRKENRMLDKIFYGVEFVDEANRIWHNDFKGVQLFDPLMQQFRKESFEHLLKKDKWAFSFYMDYDSAANTIVVCPRFGDGLYLYHTGTRQWTARPFIAASNKPAPAMIVRGFARQDAHTYTISADEGLFSFSMKTNRLTPFPFNPTLQYRRYGEILWDKKGRFWLCADVDGLICWDPATNRQRIFREALQLSTVSAHTFSLGKLYCDSRNNIWIRRTGGHSVYIDEKDTLINFLYYNDSANAFVAVHDFTEDQKGRVWISSTNGSAGYGYSHKPEAGVVRKVWWKPGNMYAEDEYSKLATGRSGHIWACSDKLLLKINPDNDSVSTYDYRYGIDSPEFFGFIVLPDDLLVLGARSSIVLADPHELRRNTEMPRPYLTELQVRQQPYRGILPVFGKGPLQLGYRENFFSFSFSAQAFSLGKQTRFRYRLQGFDDWQETTDRFFANYTNVPGGEYLFQVQAANNEGMWSSQILSVPVVIEIAWWTTAWFYAFLFIAGILIGLFLYKWRIRQVRRREQLRSEFEKKLANVEMSALRAQMNPHFLFNSLNSIDSYIIRNESRKASEYLNNFARLIRLILQNSRSNYISLKDELETLELYLQMESLRFKDKFAYELEVPEDLDTASIEIPPMLIQPYVENAIWHGLMHQPDQKEGKVKVSVRELEGMLLCIVEDNGIGRKKAMELKSKKGLSKRSMGMSITRDRMEIINKMYDTQTSVEITDLEDEQGNATGTRVVLAIPV